MHGDVVVVMAPAAACWNRRRGCKAAPCVWCAREIGRHGHGQYACRSEPTASRCAYGYMPRVAEAVNQQVKALGHVVARRMPTAALVAAQAQGGTEALRARSGMAAKSSRDMAFQTMAVRHRQNNVQEVLKLSRV